MSQDRGPEQASSQAAKPALSLPPRDSVTAAVVARAGLHEVADGVAIGPYAVVGAGCRVGRTEVLQHDLGGHVGFQRRGHEVSAGSTKDIGFIVE